MRAQPDISLLSTGAAAQLCGVDRRTMLRWTKSNLVESHRTAGGRTRIRRTDLVRFMRTRGMPDSGGPRPRGGRVLIVDDDKAHVNALQRVVLAQCPGVDCRTALDGFAAGLILSSFVPHLVFVDIVMPGIDGVEVLRRIREVRLLDSCSVVAISGRMNDRVREDLVRLGAADILPKPISPQSVQDTLRRHLSVRAVAGIKGG